MKRIALAAALLILLTGCGNRQESSIRYVALFSSGEVVQILRTTHYDRNGQDIYIYLSDGHFVRWYGDYMVSDVPIEAAEGPTIYLQGG